MDPFALLGLGGLALIDSTSFGTLVIPLILLLQPQARVGRVVMYLVTIGLFYLILGLVLFSGAVWARSTLTGVGDALSSTPAYIIQIVLGVALILLSFRYDAKAVAKRRAAAGGRASRLQRWREGAMGDRATFRAVVVLALGAGILEAASMVPYLAAIGILTTSNISIQTGIWVLIGYVLVMLLPATALIVVRTVAGKAAEPRLTRIRDWFTRHTAGALAWVLGIVGVLLILDAVRELGVRGLLLG
ncbi:MAG: GAP family protein [Salinibacterium sp.]|nr:GAP family protein [Salinibacterium sp.]